MAERVGVRELRQNLSKWLRRVESGETFEVTERGTPVALLSPIAGDGGGVLAQLAARGKVLRMPTKPVETLPEPLPARPGATPSEVLEELREERR